MRIPIVVAAGSALLLAGCRGTDEQSADAAAQTDAVTVAVSHYPVQFLVEQIGGERVTVESLTSQGTEPHDVELSPQQVGEVQSAAAVFYISGFQPAVDEAVAGAQGEVVDLSEGLPLREADDHEHEGEDHAGESAEEHEEHSGTDPHVWLDPVLMADMARSVAQTLSAADPDNAAEFEANAQTLEQQLADLDTAWTDGTAQCDIRTMVVSHEAFGYLADQYGFEQKGIAGLSPETEPSAAAIADLARFVQDNGITTVYTETLVDPAVAETVAQEAGARTATLDPLESQPASGDYNSAMRENLETMREGQSCS